MRSHIGLISVGHKLQQEGEKEEEDKREGGEGRQVHEEETVGRKVRGSVKGKDVTQVRTNPSPGISIIIF